MASPAAVCRRGSRARHLRGMPIALLLPIPLLPVPAPHRLLPRVHRPHRLDGTCRTLLVLRVVLAHRNRLADELLDRPQVLPLLAVAERDRLPALPRAGRSADAVDVR